MAHEPKTLQQAIQYFSDPNNCIDYLANRRWKDGVVCPTCGSQEVSFVPSRRVWQCKTRHPKCQFSIKVGTIFEDSPIGLDKWLTAMWMVANCKNGVSSWEIHRALGVTQKSAWFMLQRIRLALQDKQSGGKLGGGPHSKVEVDETFIGGKARNMHKSRRDRMTSYASKTAVMGILERGGRVKTAVLGNKRRGTQMQEIIRDNVASGTWIMTDEFQGYTGLSKDYTHLVANHLERYVHGNVHTQGIENFWSLLKRSLGGTYVAVEPFHLFRYVDEQAFRFNNRKDEDGNKLTDADRFDIAVSQIVGKRLTYAEVTGKVGETAF
ncbi:MAG TPA: IS1595 family transposase [Candidatus Sulfotelmatobacter sp.]|nr:IS1595 family transposase [Candidatus Sulfotelmatobacter sp.]